MPRTSASVAVLQMVEQGRRVGQDDPLDARSARCRARARARRSRAPPGRWRAARARGRVTCSDLIGLRLCGIDAGSLLAGGERLAHLGDLGTREVPQLGCEALEPGAGERDRAQQLGVAVTRDHLRGDRPRRARPSRASTLRLELGRGRGVRPDRPGERARRRPARTRARAARRCDAPRRRSPRA